MPESALSVFGLVSSTAAIVLTVAAAASTEWVQDDIAGTSASIKCGLSNCCFASMGVTDCESTVSRASALENLDGADVTPADITVTIIFTISAIFAGLTSWAISLRAVFSDGNDDKLRTAGKYTALHVFLTLIAVAVFAASDLADSLDLSLVGQYPTVEVEFAWGFWLLVAALCTSALAMILFMVAPIVSPAPTAKSTPAFTGAGAPQGV